MPESNASTSILVLHDPSLDPFPFLQRLTSDSSLHTERKCCWAIDNKYYTAEVEFDIEPLDADAVAGSSAESGLKEGVPVVLYLFSNQPPNPLPPYLTRVITSEPRDVAIAIRVRPGPKAADVEPSATNGEDAATGENEQAETGGSVDRREVDWDEVEEVFLELGMEVIDECVEDKEEDMHPLEGIRITVQTHMWPNMVRKPLGSRTAVDLDFDDDDLVNGSGSGESDYGTEPHQAEFPVGFAGPDQAFAGGEEGDEDALWAREWEGVSPADRRAAQAQFPSLELLNQQLAETTRMFAQLKVERDLAEARRMERLDRLEKALDEDSDDEAGEEGEGMRFEEEDGVDLGPGEGEWTRLEDWLDGDEDYEALGGGDGDYEALGGGDAEESGGFGGDVEEEVGGEAEVEDLPDPAAETDTTPDIPDPSQTQPSASQTIPPPHSPQPDPPTESEGFEDDFADFHSAPPPPPRLNKNGIPAELPMDPTPLLLHLQSVRAELAGVPDEDERRVRAAREVMAVLGLDMGDMELDLGEDELWAAGPRPRE